MVILSGNGEQLDLIDTALFALCLDTESPKDKAAEMRQFLHGNGANRWFDKSFSVLILPQGESCVNFEHSWGDGVAVMSFFNAIFKDTNTNPSVTSPEGGSSNPQVKKLGK